MIGAHNCNPTGTVTYSKDLYKIFHYLEINERLSYEKCLLYSSRYSNENLVNGWGADRIVTPYQNTPELIHEEFESDRKNAIKVR